MASAPNTDVILFNMMIWWRVLSVVGCRTLRISCAYLVALGTSVWLQSCCQTKQKDEREGEVVEGG